MKNVETLIEDGGEITLGRIHGIDCAASAADRSNAVAMLVRRGCMHQPGGPDHVQQRQPLPDHGRLAHRYKGTRGACGTCTMRARCLRHPERTPVHAVAAALPGAQHRQAGAQCIGRDQAVRRTARAPGLARAVQGASMCAEVRNTPTFRGETMRAVQIASEPCACSADGVLAQARQPSLGVGAGMKAVIDWSSCVAVESDPSRVSGAWVFRGTRVPVAALFENLEDGASIQEFVQWFPGVSLEQVRTVLEHAGRSSAAVA